MITTLFNHIADKIALLNLYFDNYTPLALKLKDGKVYKYNTTNEDEYCGIQDDKGQRAFYIRMEPVINFVPGRQMTSSGKYFEAQVQCTLVAYSFHNQKWNNIVVADKLKSDILGIKFNDYAGPEKSLQLAITKMNVDDLDVYQKETGEKFDGSTQFAACAITFVIKYQASDKNCLNDCGILNQYLGCVTANK